MVGNLPAGVKKEEEDEEDLFFGSDEDRSDDQEEAAPPPTNSRAKKGNGLRFGDVLQPPTPVRYSCEALTSMIDKGQIDLEAEYQRGVVWNAAKQSAVIDSIFRNCYVPPILFSIHTQINEDGDEEELRICVDGKQRLSSIHLFMRNGIPLREPHTNKAFWFKPKAHQRTALTEAQRNRFCQIQINCVEYRDLNEALERDMFQRVQMGVTLTPAEKLSANLGPWPDFLREIIKRFVENDEMSLRHLVRMDRGRDFMYMGMICLLILHCADTNFVPSSLSLAGFLKREPNPPTESQKKQLIAALAKLTALSNDDEHNAPLLPIQIAGRAVAKPIAPVEFLFAAYLCFRFPLANNEQMSKLIEGMMRRVRSEHSDLMINGKNERTIRAYIREMEVLHPFWMTQESAAGSAKGRKRPREAEQDDWLPPVDDRISSVRGRSDYLQE